MMRSTKMYRTLMATLALLWPSASGLAFSPAKETSSSFRMEALAAPSTSAIHPVLPIASAKCRLLDFVYTFYDHHGDPEMDIVGLERFAEQRPELFTALGPALQAMRVYLHNFAQAYPWLLWLLTHEPSEYPASFSEFNPREHDFSLYYSATFRRLRINMTTVQRLIRDQAMLEPIFLRWAGFLLHEAGHFMVMMKAIDWRDTTAQQDIAKMRSALLKSYRLDHHPESLAYFEGVEEDLAAERYRELVSAHTPSSEAYGAAFLANHSAQFYNGIEDEFDITLIELARDIVRWQRNGPIALYEEAKRSLSALQFSSGSREDDLLRHLVSYFHARQDALAFFPARAA